MVLAMRTYLMSSKPAQQTIDSSTARRDGVSLRGVAAPETCAGVEAFSNQQSKINNQQSKMSLSPPTATRRLDPNALTFA
jgi:hypothetical protein